VSIKQRKRIWKKDKKGEETVRVCVDVPKRIAESLQARYGKLKKGVEALIEQYEKSLGPKDPKLEKAWRALLQHATGEEPELKWRDAVDIIMYELGVDRDKATEILGDLCGEGYIATVRTGVIRVFREKQIIDPLRYIFGF